MRTLCRICVSIIRGGCIFIVYFLGDNLIEKLKDTFQNHFDLQELMHHYGDHGGFCRLLAETQYSKQEQESDNSFSAYFTTLNGIVEAIFNHLDLFEVGSNASIAALQKLCD